MLAATASLHARLYWLPVNRSVVDLVIESRLRLVESMTFVRLDFLRPGQKV